MIGLTASFIIALMIWHAYAAEAKTDAWRTSQVRVPFDNLVTFCATRSDRLARVGDSVRVCGDGRNDTAPGAVCLVAATSHSATPSPTRHHGIDLDAVYDPGS